MGKASDTGRAWASELKLKQWLRWIGGDSPLPDVRSRKVVGATAGIGLVLVALAWFALGTGGGKPATGVKPNTSATPRYSLFAPPRSAVQHGFFHAPAKTSTATTSSTSTTVLSSAAASKRPHSHTRHTGQKRTHTRGLG